MRVWIIPMIYVLAALAFGQVLPRFELAYGANDLLGISVSSAQGCMAAVASGMLALTGVVFALAFHLFPGHSWVGFQEKICGITHPPRKKQSSH
jgi:uncharacterized membrane protein